MSVEAQIVSSNNAPKLINAWELKDGQIGIIRQWGDTSSRFYEGKIVQRWRDHLICIGIESGNSWTDFFKIYTMENSRGNLLLEILPSNSSILLINENE